MGNSAPKPTLSEQIREHKRVITRAVRELDREKAKLANEDTRLKNEIRAEAKKNNLASVRILAKDLVRNKKYITKFMLMRSHLQAVSLRVQSVKSAEAMSRSLKATTAVMQKINASLDLPELTKVLEDFQKETENLGVTEDVMGDAIDGVLREAGDAEEEETLVAEVLDEVGIDFKQLLAGAPKDSLVKEKQKLVPISVAAAGGSTAAPQAPAAAKAGDNFVDDLEDRLKNNK
jgi:charged multivesicular body protein 2A